MKSARSYLLVSGTSLLVALPAFAENPIIRDQFTADPTARVFDGKIYLYPSHDLPPPPGRRGGFRMADYHVFSSDDLMAWIDHGVIVSQEKVDWVNAESFSMWAPDCVFKDGKYYFYFPANPKGGGQKRIGVAVADTPTGPFKPEPTYIQGIVGIDPSILIEKDGSAYIFYSLNKLYAARLKGNMTEIEGEPVVFENLTTDRGLLEGPFVFERNGIYYLTYPHAVRTERLEYAISDKPLGPYKWMGVIMDQSPSGCWTNHHSIVEFKNQWYLFYHDKDLATRDTNRSVKIDYLTFNPDGTIQKVIPTHRGVGVKDARSILQIDRFSDSSKEGIAISYLTPDNTFNGWKTAFSERRAWIRYNAVNFDAALKSVSLSAKSATGGMLEIRVDSPDSTPFGRVQVEKSEDWKTVTTALDAVPAGKHDLIVTLTDGNQVEVDWVRFE